MTGAQTQTLEAGMRAKTSPQRVVIRSRICLLAAEGLPNNASAHRWEPSRPTMRLWRTGFNEAGSVGSVRGCPAWASAHHLSPRKVRASVEATRCVETLTDVVGVDEQPQIHALDRTHPGVPVKKGRCGP